MFCATKVYAALPVCLGRAAYSYVLFSFIELSMTKEIGRKLVVNLSRRCSKAQQLLALFHKTFSLAEYLYIHNYKPPKS